jgi:hypothetical protein
LQLEPLVLGTGNVRSLITAYLIRTRDSWKKPFAVAFVVVLVVLALQMGLAAFHISVVGDA